MVLPEQVTNLVRGQGFRNHDQVLSRFVANGNQQKALNYFGFEGTYDPNNELVQGNDGITNPRTGDIFYGKSAFNGGFDKLHYVADHEMKHRATVLSGKYKNIEITKKMAAKEEFDTYVYNYQRQGLYINSGQDIGNRINMYGSEARVNSDIIF